MILATLSLVAGACGGSTELGTPTAPEAVGSSGRGPAPAAQAEKGAEIGVQSRSTPSIIVTDGRIGIWEVSADGSMQQLHEPTEITSSGIGGVWPGPFFANSTAQFFAQSLRDDDRSDNAQDYEIVRVHKEDGTVTNVYVERQPPDQLFAAERILAVTESEVLIQERATVDGSSSVVRLDADTGERLGSVEQPDEKCGRIEFVGIGPDGRLLAVSHHGPIALDTATGETYPIDYCESLADTLGDFVDGGSVMAQVAVADNGVFTEGHLEELLISRVSSTPSSAVIGDGDLWWHTTQTVFDPDFGHIAALEFVVQFDLASWSVVAVHLYPVPAELIDCSDGECRQGFGLKIADFDDSHVVLGDASVQQEPYLPIIILDTKTGEVVEIATDGATRTSLLPSNRFDEGHGGWIFSTQEEARDISRVDPSTGELLETISVIEVFSS